MVVCAEIQFDGFPGIPGAPLSTLFQKSERDVATGSFSLLFSFLLYQSGQICSGPFKGLSYFIHKFSTSISDHLSTGTEL